MSLTKVLSRPKYPLEEVLSWPIDPEDKYYHEPGTDVKIFIGNPKLIGKNVFLGDRVKIGHRTEIDDNVWIQSKASIGSKTYIGTHSTIGEYVRIGDLCFLSRNTTIENLATVSSRVYLGPHFTLASEQIVEPNVDLAGYQKMVRSMPIIRGSQHEVFWYDKRMLTIGCIRLSIEDWLQKYEELGKKHKYTEVQIQEYLSYIKAMKSIGPPFK